VRQRLFTAVVVIATASSATELTRELPRIMQGRSGTAVVVELASRRVLAAYHLKVAARRLARPGSTFKPFTLLALLQSGKLRPTDSLACRRKFHVGGHDLSCSHPQAGLLEARSALAYSCNTFFATFGSRLTSEELSEAFTRAGLASPSALARREAVGFIHPARTNEERQLQAVGDGDMRVTPLEMLAAYRKLALRRTASDVSDGERVVFQGLEDATEYGLVRLASAPDVKVAGKTGTTRADNGAWTNAWFVGYAPADKPSIVLLVFLERGTGPGDAAPIAGEILRAWHKGHKP
jgi:cell division protein FtsI/penicillin-binding protein 2